MGNSVDKNSTSRDTGRQQAEAAEIHPDDGRGIRNDQPTPKSDVVERVSEQYSKEIAKTLDSK